MGFAPLTSTTNQLIALLFPVAGASSAVAAGLLAKWIWVDRPRAKEARVATAQDGHILSVETIDAISAADDLVEQAHRKLERARRGLQEQH